MTAAFIQVGPHAGDHPRLAMVASRDAKQIA
jgi:hypothetical protein